MANNLFREKSLNRVNSPEQLNEYIRVTTPGTWLILGAILIFLVGVCTWGIFGHLETSIDVGVISENGTVTVYIPEEDAGTVEEGMEITVGDVSGTITSVGHDVVSSSDISPHLTHMIGMDEETWTVTATCDLMPPDGEYAGRITTESITPMSFITN